MPNRWLCSIVASMLVLGCRAAAPTEPMTEPEPKPEVVEAGSVEPSAGGTDDPSRTPSNPASPSTSAEPPPARATPAVVTGITACDEYISLYERCEPILRAEIMAGDRRPPNAERGWLEFLAGTPERASLPEACQSMLTKLRPRCPVPEPAATGVPR